MRPLLGLQAKNKIVKNRRKRVVDNKPPIPKMNLKQKQTAGSQIFRLLALVITCVMFKLFLPEKLVKTYRLFNKKVPLKFSSVDNL